MTALDTFKQLVGKFEKAQNSYRRYGAADTEPDGVFQSLLVQASAGKKPDVPKDVRSWQLYSEMSGNGLAAAALHRAALKCVSFLADMDKLPYGEAKQVVSYVTDYCWRC